MEANYRCNETISGAKNKEKRSENGGERNEEILKLQEEVPNGIGCLFGVVQLLLYAIYRNGKPSKIGLSEKLIEEGSQEPMLISSLTQNSKIDAT
ncbi:Bidirectional sugar transporter SWEET17 [Bienertia sinuspersici]